MAAGAGPHKPGAAMTPVAGCVPALLDATTGAEIPAVIGEEAKGLLVLKQPWPSMARTCWGDHERFENTYFSYDGYYLTGDGARRDADGHYWITGRVDDVVVVSGHNIGTAEVESALVAHPAVSFCGVLAPFLPFFRLRLGAVPAARAAFGPAVLAVPPSRRGLSDASSLRTRPGRRRPGDAAATAAPAVMARVPSLACCRGADEPTADPGEG